MNSKKIPLIEKCFLKKRLNFLKNFDKLIINFFKN